MVSMVISICRDEIFEKMVLLWSGVVPVEMLQTVVTSAIVATIVGFLLELWRDGRRERVSVRHEALSLAVALEGYSIACANKLANHEAAESSDGYAGEYMASVPDFPKFSVGAPLLKAEKADLANRILLLPQEVAQAEQESAFWWDVVGDLGAARNAARKGSARVGLNCIEISRRLREVYKLPTRSLVFGEHDIEKHFEIILGRLAT